MGKLRELNQKMLNVQEMEIVLLDIIKKFEEQITQLNKDQLQDSLDADGEPLGEYRSIAYANLKGRITVDLKLTGDFYDSFFLQLEKFPILFGAADSKTFELKEKYGSEILGLTEQSKDKLRQGIIKTELQAWFHQSIKV